MSNGGSSSWHGRMIPVGRLLRASTDPVDCENSHLRSGLRVRGKVRQDAVDAGDPDNGDYRARRTRGWKSGKYPHKWEHNFIERSKHSKSRLRKAVRRTGKSDGGA